MSTFEELLAEAEEVGVPEDLLDRFKAAAEASPLRKELKDTKAQLQTHIDRAQKAEAVALATQFEKLGIRGKPQSYRLPDDVDVTDEEALRVWAVDNGVLDPPKPDVSDGHLDALDRVAAASDGATTGRIDPSDAVMQAESEEEFYRRAAEAGLTQ